jgi:hypothetical protein
MSAKWVRIFVITLYIIIGVVMAWEHHYLGLAWVRSLATVLLAVFFWWLIPLGVDLHIHG